MATTEDRHEDLIQHLFLANDDGQSGNADFPALDGFDAPQRLSPRITDDLQTNLVYLSWTAVTGVESYAVYVGPDTNPPLVATVTVNNYVVRDLPECSRQYWRVVALRGESAVSSTTWNFTTRCPDQAEPE